ncbi:hypothetical protein P4S72_30455, partial [Vibrio sp. PP-XX7]
LRFGCLTVFTFIVKRFRVFRAPLHVGLSSHRLRFLLLQDFVAASSFPMLIALHLMAGLGAGAALSSVHGTIGRTENPHRLFGLVPVVALGVLAADLICRPS